MQRTTMTRCVAACLALAATSAALAQDTTAGRNKAKSTCAVCHGEFGMSTMPNTPHIAGQPEAYLVEQLKAYRGGKRANEVMGVVTKGLSDDDIANVAAWYASVSIKVEPRP